MLLLANAGIPMLFFHLPAMALALVPVVAVEWFVAHRQFGISKKKAFKGVVAANCFSTLLGFPLFWLIGVLLLFVVGPHVARSLPQAPSTVGKVVEFGSGMVWLGPDADLRRIVFAGLAMLVPAFFVSVLSERWILRSMWPDIQVAESSRFAWVAHLWSYPILAGVWLCYVVRAW